jgi:hypothetical protein
VRGFWAGWLVAVLGCSGGPHATGLTGDAATTAEAGRDAGRDSNGWGPPIPCPADPDRSGPCARLGDTCTVDGACCLCQVVSVCSEAQVWTCRRPSPEPACGGPAAPALKSACAVERQQCYYCTAGDLPVARECARGQWVEGALRICR